MHYIKRIINDGPCRQKYSLTIDLTEDQKEELKNALNTVEKYKKLVKNIGADWQTVEFTNDLEIIVENGSCG